METLTDDRPGFFSAPGFTLASGSDLSPQSQPESPDEWDGKPLPPEVANHPLLDEAAWVAHRDSGRMPMDCTELRTTYQDRAEFLVGAWLLRLVVPKRFGIGTLLDNLQPQMLREVDVMAAGKTITAILMPRRSSKTTTLWCVAVGRAYMRPTYMVGYTMLTLAKKAEKRFELDVRDPISVAWPDPHTRPVKLRDGKGGKGIDFSNYSKLDVLAPKGEEVRSGAYDLMIIDESGEADPVMWDDVTGAVLPSFDTRPGAQAILAGTAAKYRTGGHFWRSLHDEKAARLRYGVPDDIDPADLEFWDVVEGLIRDLHPGLDGLTNMDAIERNFHGLGWERFALEYLGHFGDENSTSTAITAQTWKKHRQDGPPPEGIRVGSLAVSVSPDGGYASIVVAFHITTPDDLVAAAWESDGVTERARVGFKVIHDGTDGIERSLIMTSRALRAPIIYDHGNSASRALVERVLKRSRPTPATTPKQLSDVRVAHAQFIRDLSKAEVWHWDQGVMDRAAAGAVLQTVGQGALIRSPKGESLNVTSLEAAALALNDLPALAVSDYDASDAFDFG